MKSNDATIIDTVDKNNNSLKLIVNTPGIKVLQESQMVYNIKLTSLIKRSATEGVQLLSKQQLDSHLEKLDIWTETDGKDFLKLQLELRSMELQLKQGGIKVSEAKKIALSMKTQRAILLALYQRRAQFDNITMESISDNEKFKFLMTACVFTENDLPFFTSIDDYESRQNEQATIDASTLLAGKLYGYDKDAECSLIENKWLKQFDFADSHGRLVDKKNRLIDSDGRLIDKNGRFINDKGEFVDAKGTRVNEDGDFIIKTRPFIDDKTGKSITGKKRTAKKV